MDYLSVVLTVLYLGFGLGAAKMNLIVEKSDEVSLFDIIAWPLMLLVHAFTLKKDGS